MMTNYFTVYSNGSYSYCEYYYSDDVSFCEHLENVIGDYSRFIPIENSDNLYWGVNELTTPETDEIKVIVKTNCSQAYKNEEFECLTSTDIDFVKELLTK